MQTGNTAVFIVVVHYQRPGSQNSPILLPQYPLRTGTVDILAVMMAPLMAVATCRAAQAHAQHLNVLQKPCATGSISQQTQAVGVHGHKWLQLPLCATAAAKLVAVTACSLKSRCNAACGRQSLIKTHLLGTLHAQPHVPIVVAHNDKGLEPCALPGTRLLLDRHDFHDLILHIALP